MAFSLFLSSFIYRRFVNGLGFTALNEMRGHGENKDMS
jgi:hypothetical protein